MFLSDLLQQDLGNGENSRAKIISNDFENVINLNILNPFSNHTNTDK